MPQNTVNTLVRDKTGYLWIGTQEGLARFDGSHFHTFNRREMADFDLKEINALFADRKEGVWAASQGYGFIHLAENRVINYSLGEGTQAVFINALYQDHDGRVYIGTNRGLWILQPGDQEAQRVADDHPLRNQEIHCFLEIEAGAFWIGTGQGLFRFEGGAVRVVRFTQRDRGYPISALAGDQNDGGLWIGTAGWGVRLFDGERVVRTLTRDEGLINNQIAALTVDRDGNLWVGTGLGVNRVNGDRIATFSVENQLSFPAVLSLLEDNEGNLWIGTLGGGLNQLRDGAFTPFSRRQNLPGNETICLTQDPKGRYWIGTAGFGVAMMEGGAITNFRREDGLPSNFVLSTYCDRDGRIWIGTDSGLVVREGDRWVEPFWTDSLGSKFIRAIFQDSEDRIWIGTQTGVSIFDGYQVVNFGKESDIRIGTTRAILEDPQGRIWIGARDGVFMFEGTQPRQHYGPDLGLYDTFVLSLHLDQDGILWAGTNAHGIFGLFNGRFHGVGEHLGLFNDSVFQIVRDPNDTFWMSCNLGVFSVQRQALIDVIQGKRERVFSEIYNEADGLPSRECIGVGNSCSLVDQNGHIWFPTIKGVARINPLQKNHWQREGRILVEQVIVDEKTIFPETDGTVTVPAGSDRIRFRYTNIFFSLPHRVHFRTKLEGYDDTWINQNDDRVADYTNLSPGNYRFLVESGIREGEYHGGAVALPVYVKPHIYQTAWFMILCIFAGIFLVWAGVRLKVKRFQIQQVHLEALIDQRTAELKASNDALAETTLQLREMSVTDPLTGLKNRRFLKDLMASEITHPPRVLKERRGTLSQAPPRIFFLMMDLDHFKSFNDQYGHNAGDIILKSVSQLLLETCRDSDVVTRWGGEEFLILFRHAPEDFAQNMAERIRNLVADYPIELDSGEQVHITTSIGYAHFPFMPDNPFQFSWEEVVNIADHALYAAKFSGRNAWVGLRAGSNEPEQNYNDLIVDIPARLADGSLMVETSLDLSTLIWAKN
ncbi:ligand-binding sensor domain-containing diguanylate cyclase [Acanthopleuribacter pedis]|uniref:diguanylate cyclase n=1 Tax=Acanthopleuribacter pedis TaxID=442870 RepID=A0A8J7QCC5_9BACT|nr:ligand-binding sensor domain-containing diguanylate cyclase [Acanthopleuribacter pedis]MBO1316940.1 diguanylate cyclase [Acanthopleuribacter pedis]